MKIPKPKKTKNPIPRLRSKALKLWYDRYLKDVCEICGSTFVLQAHHFYYRSSYGHLMFEEANHITLCRGCHFTLHTQDPKKIETGIIENRGEEWHNELWILAKEKPKPSYQTAGYYKQMIETLKVAEENND